MVVNILILKSWLVPPLGRESLAGIQAKMLLVHVLKFQFPKSQFWMLLVIMECSVDMRYIIPRNQNLPKLQAPGGDVILAKRFFAIKDVTVCFVCFVCWVTKLCSTLCDPMDCSLPGFPVLHYLPKFLKIHVHWVNDAIQPSHPLSPPSPPAFNLSQHQGLFQWVSSSHQVTKVLELQLQHQSFQWITRVDFL